MPINKLYKAILIYMVVLILGSGVKLIYANDEEKQIVVLNSYSSGFKWTDDQVEGIVETMLEDNPECVIHIEYLDQKSFSEQQILDKKYELYEMKYGSENIDLVVTTDDAAMQFAIDHREVFDNAPIVFGSVNKASAIVRMHGVERITGVYENIDTEGTASLIKHVHKDVKIVYAITENTESGWSTWKRIQAGFSKLKDSNIKVVNLNKKSYEDIKGILNNPEENSVAVMASYSTDLAGVAYSPVEVSKEFGMMSKMPIYILHDNIMNEYVMGGTILSGRLHGVQIGQLANQFLKGTDIDEIAIDDSIMSSKLINYHPLVKYDIVETNIPKGYEVVNKPFSVFETYKLYIYGAVVVFFILTFLIIGMLFNIVLRKKAQKDLLIKHKELARVHEEVSASEEELKAQNDELFFKQIQLKESEEKYRLTSESANDIHWSWDLLNNKRYIGKKLYQLLGYEIGSIDTQNKWYDIIHPEDIKLLNDNVERYFSGLDDKYSLEFRVQNVKGDYFYLLSTAKGVEDEEGNYVKLYGTYTDITQAKKDHEQISELAYSDYLTKLPNRMTIREITEQLIKTRKDDPIVLYFIDLDNFKYINNSYGHQVGDGLLVEVSTRLKAMKTDNIHVGRIGGDEFVIVVEDVLHNIEAFTDDLLNVFRLPFEMDGRSIYSTASIGYAIYPEDGNGYDELLVKADIAMYKMKECGKNQIDRFVDSMEDEMSEKIEYLTALSQALGREELFLEYQPIYAAESKSVSGFEALLRWESEELGRVSPDKFIPLAESCGLIIPIGRFVLEKALRFAKDINENVESKKIVAINISVVQLYVNDFVEQVEQILDEVGVDPTLIEFEVTESIYANNFEMFRMQLEKIKALDISLSLDDFGTGYSSLTYLHMIPFSKLKIDKKFIDDIMYEEHDHVLLETIITMGHNMGLNIVAEGVEEKEQYEYLKEHECQLIQGYYFSKSMSESECRDILEGESQLVN